jgi:DNA ligase-1
MAKDNKIRPQLACDFDQDKLRFPVIVSAKIDGVRGINLDGNLTGRSLKAFKNSFVTRRFSGPQFKGFDGELALGNWTSDTLCSDTTGFVNRKSPKPGKPTESEQLVWYVFDYLADDVIDLPYAERIAAAEVKIGRMQEFPGLIATVPYKLVNSVEELLAFEQLCLDDGFEGVIIRDPNGMHKSGRATVKGGSYLRIKRFIDFEGIVVNITEAMENTNEAKTNELGRTERGTHQENMVPKGMVGMVQFKALQNVELDGKILIEKDQIVDVGPGSMLHEDRVEFFEQQDLLIGKIGKAKFFPKGIKDKPRFPTFLCIRAEEDMSE